MMSMAGQVTIFLILKAVVMPRPFDLTEEKEPEIYNAIRPGALVENVTFIQGTNKIDFEDDTITENTRVSYPLNFISNALPCHWQNT